MDDVASLRATLVSALAAGGGDGAEQDLFDELTVNKSRLLKVFDFGARNPQEQREIESGKVVVDGRTLSVNSEFARHVAFISQQVNCSERFIAGILHSVLSEYPTTSKVEAVEQAVLSYHELRRQLADCIHFIFEAVEKAEEPDALPIHTLLNDFVHRQLIRKDDLITSHIFLELTNLGKTISEARTAVTNAISQTNIPGPQGGISGNLGQPTLQARLESLLYERRTLAIAFYFCARAGYLSSADLSRALDWLEKNPKNDMTLYILASLFAALDLSHSPPASQSAQMRLDIAKDNNIVSSIGKKLAPTVEWKDSSLKSVVSLKWTLFLAEARFRNQDFEHVEGFRNEDLTIQVFNAIQGDAFSFLLRVVTHLSTEKSMSSQLLANSMAPGAMGGEPNDGIAPVSDDFKPNVLHEVELLLRSLLMHAPAELRKVKHKQEDQFRPRAERHVRSGLRPAESSAGPVPPRNDIAILFQLVGQLYSVLPEDSAIQFWGGAPRTDTPMYYEKTEVEAGRLPSFLRWAVEVREPDLIICVFDMLAGLSTGVACAECAYNFMAIGSLDVVHGPSGLETGRYEMTTIFTWRSIFGELESWATLGSSQRTQHGVPPPQLQIAATDVLLGLAFLKLTASVAKHSIQARIAVATHPQYRAIGCLVSLIPLGVPLELKGALFETLSAFCHPGAGVQGVDICKNVWGQMERLEVINVRGGGFGPKGVEIELEEVESVYRVYPATIAFLELLSTLIHTPKRIPLKNRVTEPEPIQTIPENLGVPYRAPGIGPFINFVVDNVLARLPRREFLNVADSWKMADFALCFLERCLASYDLESLPTLAEEFVAKGPEVLAPVVHHPGFEVLVRILSETQLRTTLLTYVVEGVEELSRQPVKSRFTDVILRVLRITDRVLEIQDLFLDHLVPAVLDFDSIVVAGSRISQSFLSRIDQGLSLDQRSIPAIGSYVNCVTNPEIKYLAIKIMSALSQSPSFQNIAGLIARSPESTIILDGFVNLLSSDSADDVGEAEEWADLWTGAGAPDLDGQQDLLGQAIRLAILDLLLRGTKHTKSSSLSFLLLFGKSTPDAQIQDPHALGSRKLCLHVVLELLNIGIPRLNEKGKDKERQRSATSTPLFECQPVLAERLYKLVYQLCEHPRTSTSMLLYLRTREDFFARHLAAMVIHTPIDQRAPVIEVVYGDGSRVVTTCTAMKAFLQSRSWLLDLVSLELHVLTNKGQNQRVKELLDLLFGATETYHEPENDWEHDVFQPFNDVGQSRIRIIEILQSLEFEWYDSVAVTPTDLQFYSSLNLQSCVRTDENGCEVIDRTALFELLSNARRTLLRQGLVVNAMHNAQLEAETKYILASSVAENNRREIQFALGIGYESWKKLLDVVLTKCFNRISHDQRESILFDLLHVVPPVIRSSTLLEQSATLLSGTLLLLITKLREERHQAYLLSASDSLDSSALPVERMSALLRHILDCILDKHRGELVRGNVYAALINFLHLIMKTPGEIPSKTTILPSENSLANLTSALTLSAGDVKRVNSAAASLEANCFMVVKQVMERLVTTIAKDAIDGTEVWKTVAFTLLEALTRLSRNDSKQVFLNTLERYGLLSNFVHSIVDSDSSLQDVLRPEPDDLNPLYVYETRMAFFIRLAHTRQGAERLLESRVLRVLSQIDFLDARPESGDSILDQNSFLPSALSRYHQLFVPSLQLVTDLIATLGSRHTAVSKQSLEFLYSHKDTFIIMLKQDTSLSTISTVQELDLIISLCALIIPSVPETDFVATNTGFGNVHNAILGLASKTLGNSRWVASIRPSDETETIEATTVASGGSDDTKFEVRVRQIVQSLRRAIVGYLSAATDVGESDLTVVLAPTLSPRDDRPSGVTVALPSLKDAADFLSDLCDDLLGTMQDIDDIASELEQPDHVRIDNVEDLLGDVDVDAIRKLEIGQRRALVCRTLERSLASRRSRAETLLSTIEKLLYLLWRHIGFYTSGQMGSSVTFDRQRPFSRPQASVSGSRSHLKASTLRYLAVPDADTFRHEAWNALAKVVEKIDSIELDEEIVGREWRASQTFLDQMSRRIREAVAADVSPTEDARE